MHRHCGIHQHSLGRQRIAHIKEVPGNRFRGHSPGEGGVAAKGLLVEEVPPPTDGLGQEQPGEAAVHNREDAGFF